MKTKTKGTEMKYIVIWNGNTSGYTFHYRGSVIVDSLEEALKWVNDKLESITKKTIKSFSEKDVTKLETDDFGINFEVEAKVIQFSLYEDDEEGNECEFIIKPIA